MSIIEPTERIAFIVLDLKRRFSLLVAFVTAYVTIPAVIPTATPLQIEATFIIFNYPPFGFRAFMPCKNILRRILKNNRVKSGFFQERLSLISKKKD